MTFLQALIYEVLRENPKEPAPRLLANRVLRRIPDDRLREALDECLMHEVREIIRRERTIVARERARNRKPSAKWGRAIRSIMDTQVHTGMDWKRLGDCTIEDITSIASEYGRRAEENYNQAQRYYDLSALLEREGAVNVEQLDAREVQQALYPVEAKVSG